MQTAAVALGIQLQPLRLREIGALEAAFEAARNGHADGLIVVSSSLIRASGRRIAALGMRNGLPIMAQSSDLVSVGALMSYGPNIADLQRRAAAYVDRILKGAKPADLPVEQPSKFDFVVNLKTAQALGLNIPQDVLLQATEVIQ